METSSLWAAKSTTAALLAAIAACVPEASPVHQSATVLNGNPRAVLYNQGQLTLDIVPGDKDPPAQPCLVGTRSCLSMMDRRPAGPCLLSTRRCPDEGRLELIRSATP